MAQAPIASLPERWSEISDFPNYSVSDWGKVMNNQSGRLITPAINSRGVVIVGLMLNAKQQAKRSLALLVANAYVLKPSKPAFNTPIHLNGDVTNNHYTNLEWRPLWFARKYKQQFHDDHPTFDRPIEDVETGITYKDSWSAAIHHGLLDYEIYMSMINNTYVWPTGQIFREVV